jgi:hypothetical protein
METELALPVTAFAEIIGSSTMPIEDRVLRILQKGANGVTLD